MFLRIGDHFLLNLHKIHCNLESECEKRINLIVAKKSIFISIKNSVKCRKNGGQLGIAFKMQKNALQIKSRQIRISNNLLVILKSPRTRRENNKIQVFHCTSRAQNPIRRESLKF